MTAATIRARCARRSTRSAASTRFARASARRASDGRYLGLGIGCYVEGTGVGPFESATVRIDPSGKIYVSSGACPQGQGMETIFAQVVADTWSVDPDDVVMSLADTAAIAIGFGTIASRSTVTLSAAIHGASERLRAKVFAIAANLLECAAGRPRAARRRRRHRRRAGRRGVARHRWRRRRVRAGTTAARQASMPGWRRPIYYEPPTVTWSYAVHVAIVEVDIELGRVSIEKYVDRA